MTMSNDCDRTPASYCPVSRVSQLKNRTASWTWDAGDGAGAGNALSGKVLISAKAHIFCLLMAASLDRLVLAPINTNEAYLYRALLGAAVAMRSANRSRVVEGRPLRFNNNFTVKLPENT